MKRMKISKIQLVILNKKDIVYRKGSVLRGCTELYGQLHALYSFLYLPL